MLAARSPDEEKLIGPPEQEMANNLAARSTRASGRRGQTLQRLEAEPSGKAFGGPAIQGLLGHPARSRAGYCILNFLQVRKAQHPTVWILEPQVAHWATPL